LRCDPLDRTPELDVRLEELVAFTAVLAGLARKTDVRVYGQQGSV
jgi:hypothetical protein